MKTYYLRNYRNPEDVILLQREELTESQLHEIHRDGYRVEFVIDTPQIFRVFFTARFVEYSRNFTDIVEAESFYQGALKNKSWRNVKLQIG